MILISPTKLKENENDYLIVDIREDYEYEEANIGSLHIPMGDVADRIDELKTNKTIAVLCRSGRRAEAVVNLLQNEFNMDNVVIVEGGILAWKDQIDATLPL